MKKLLLVLLPILSGCATRVPGTGVTWHDLPRPDWPLPPGPRVDWSAGLSLQELLEAVEASPAVQHRLYELEMEAKRTRAGAEMIPDCGTELTAATGSGAHRTAVGAEIRQVIDVGKRAKWRKGAAGLEVAESEAGAREVLRVALTGAERAYWRAAAAEMRWIAPQRVASAAPGTVSDPRGFADRVAAERIATRRELELLAGGYAPEGWTLADPLPLDRRRADFARACDLALASRPLMAATAAAHGAARARVRLVESAGSTDVGFGVGYQVEKDDHDVTHDGFRVVERKLFAGVSFTIPGQPPGRLGPAERASRLRLKALSLAQATVLREVEAAFRRLEAAADRGLDSIDARAENVDARVELEGAVGRPLAEFAK